MTSDPLHESSLADFIPNYPSTKNEQFSYRLFRRQEFNELELDATEAKPTVQGKLLKDQLFIKRFISEHTPYNRCLLFRGIGTGKTCVSSAVIENFKNVTVGGKKRKPALVLVKNDGLAKLYRQMIVQVCTTEGTYVAEQKKEGEMMKEETIKRRLKASVNETYEIKTYETFSTITQGQKRIAKKFSDEEVAEYSNRIIVLDESHSLRKDNTSYQVIHNLLHRVTDCRIIIMSGSPYVDDISEISTQLNLLLPLDKQLPTGTKFNSRYFDKQGILRHEDELFDHTVGIVSFIRSSNIDSRRVDNGDTESYQTLKPVYPNIMSQVQFEAWKQAIAKDEKKRDPALRDGRDASNFVYPKIVDSGDEKKIDGTITGGAAFKRYFIKRVRTQGGDKLTYGFPNDKATASLLKNAFRDDLATYSTKFKSIIDDIITHPNDLIFVYTDEFVRNAGAILFGLCLGLQPNMRKVNTDKQIMVSSTVERRFVVFTGSSSKEEINKMLAQINRPENINGDYCQVVIASEVLGIGYTFKNFTRFHSLTPTWNPPTIDQAEGRVYRFGAHSALPPERRQVDFFNHVAVTEDTDIETTDIRVQRLADAKEYKFAQIRRFLKVVAFDCPANYRRNVLPDDVDKSRECDYTDCNYKCYQYPDEFIDDTDRVWRYTIPEDDVLSQSFDAYYARDIVASLRQQILELFSTSYFSLTLGTMIELTESKPILLLQALDSIISNRVPIKNRYGFITYLKEDGDVYFLEDNMNLTTSYANSFYTAQPFVIEKTTADTLAIVKRYEDDESKISKAVQTMSVDDLSETTRIALWEDMWRENRDHDFTQLLGKSLNTDTYQIEMSDKTYHIFYRRAYSKQEKYIPSLLTRVYNDDTKTWEYASAKEEEEVLLSIKNKESGSSLAEEPIYGTFKDDQFTIVRKGKGRGMACMSFQKPQLKQIYADLKIKLPEGDQKKETLCATLLEAMREQGLVEEKK